MAGAPLGYVLGPEDLIIDKDGAPQRIDKAYSWDAPMSAHGLMHMVISNAVAGDPVSGGCVVHVYGQYGVEFINEYARCHGYADRKGSRNRRI